MGAPRPGDATDKVAAVNISSFAERAWKDAEEQYEAALLDAVPRVNGEMLDVGCDDGTWTEEVRLRAGVEPAQVHGIEIVDDRRELAIRRGFSVKPADLEQPWPYEDELFALVHANQVIEHVKRLDHFALETKRVLKPGGYAVICTENLASWHNVAALLLGYQPFSITNISSTGALGNPFAIHERCEFLDMGESWQHIHVVTFVALVQLFERHGFEVEHSFARGYHPFRGRLSRALATRDPRHGHFIGVRARRPG